jgi:segregation and condensation protein A
MPDPAAPISPSHAPLHADDYRVHLDSFEGPLDLLLYLIRRDEIDLHDIPVARITQQYLAFLGQIDRIDIDAAGEFLVMAATLMEIKSRMLVPGEAESTPSAAGSSSPSASDPRSDLVRQLLEYKRYRDAATVLERRFSEWSGRFPSAAAAAAQAPDTASDPDEPVDLGDLELFDLLSAFQRIMDSVNFDRLGSHEVQYDDTPIELHAEDIVDRLRRENAYASAFEPASEHSPVGGDPAHADDPPASGYELSRIFAGRTRSEMIGLFLAVLDLVRRNRLQVRQDRIAGQVSLALAPTERDSIPPG